MSRSGYSDDLDNWALIKWRGRAASAARGKRGQEFFRDLLTALDAMPVKELVEAEFVVGPDNFAIAFLPIGKRPRDQASAIADARLIAAAPDLLEALRACLQCFAEMNGRKPAFVEDSIAISNEAITRATGADHA